MARWTEYRGFLELAIESGYRILAVEDWIRLGPQPDPILAIRHDVDQHPASALAMARIEHELGVRSTWYFRWRTADRSVIRSLREDGCSVGLHYESLSRLALQQGAHVPEEVDKLVPKARALLRAEVEAFERLHGPTRSVCPHGDSRVGAARNAALVRGEDISSFGVEFDANEAMRGLRPAHWLTDRSRAEGSWADGVDPAGLLRAGVSPILGVVHPNNWASGPSLWIDRLMRAALPPSNGTIDRAGSRLLRTGSDSPPLDADVADAV